MVATGWTCVLVIGIWQWFRRITFSVTSQKTIHHKSESETKRVNQLISIASGRRCKKASPKSAHAEKLTKNNKIFLRKVVLNHKVTIPTKETILTITTLINAYKKAIFKIYNLKFKIILNGFSPYSLI